MRSVPRVASGKMKTENMISSDSLSHIFAIYQAAKTVINISKNLMNEIVKLAIAFILLVCAGCSSVKNPGNTMMP